MNKQNKYGFTLAELLIVVAIIAVLVAIAIPVFTSQLEKSRETTDVANLRSAYAEAVAKYLTNEADASSESYSVQQKTASWDIKPSLDSDLAGIASQLATKTSGTFKVSYSDAGPSIDFN